MSAEQARVGLYCATPRYEWRRHDSADDAIAVGAARACELRFESEPKSASESIAEAEAAALRLYVFDCGRVRFDDEQLDAFDFGLTSEETDVRVLIASCYVVEHERGRLLWDGGLPLATAETEGWREVDGKQLRLDRRLADQLAEIDLDFTAFDYVAFSHMQHDHVGVANEVEGATLLIQGPEYEAAFADEITVYGYRPALYEGLRNAERQILDGEHDVFGDGRVRILPAPGHTPGHQMLFVDLAETGPVLLSGDLYHFQFNRDHRRVPSINVDAEETLASMERTEQFLEESGAELWIQHELKRFEQVERAPAYNQ